MATMTVQGVPEVVRKNALSVGAAAWLDELAAFVADLERGEAQQPRASGFRPRKTGEPLDGPASGSRT